MAATASCIQQHGPAPPLPVSFTVVGLDTEEPPTINVASDGSPLEVVVATVDADPPPVIKNAVFEIAREDSTDPGPALRHFPVESPWANGVHSVRLDWDGRDDDGQVIPSGIYVFRVHFDQAGQRRVRCVDGSTALVDAGGTNWGSGLAEIVVSA
jgi:hypothetical protein